MIYLAVQVRHSRNLLDEHKKITLSQVYQNRTTQRMENLRFLASNGELARLVAEVDAKGVDAVRSFTIAEKTRLRAFCDAQIMGVNNSLYQSEIGVLDDLDVDETIATIIRERMPLWQAVGCRIPARLATSHDHDKAPA